MSDALVLGLLEFKLLHLILHLLEFYAEQVLLLGFHGDLFDFIDEAVEVSEL